MFGFFQARNYIQSLPPLKQKNFKEVFKGANPLGIYFVLIFFSLLLNFKQSRPMPTKKGMNSPLQIIIVSEYTKTNLAKVDSKQLFFFEYGNTNGCLLFIHKYLIWNTLFKLEGHIFCVSFPFNTILNQLHVLNKLKFLKKRFIWILLNFLVGKLMCQKCKGV